MFPVSLGYKQVHKPLTVQGKCTLGARGFSCAVSGVGHVCRSEAKYFRQSRAKKETSGTQSKGRITRV